jgi:hypothetical protein
MKSFLPTWLYIKRHRITGLKYFGKTVSVDPYTYCGSGKVWLRHINKYGKEYIDTIWICKFDNKNELIDFALAFSEIFNIVNSTEWANISPENGIDGGYRVNNHFKILNSMPMSESRKKSISKSQIGLPGRKVVPIEISGIRYESIRTASNNLGICEQELYRWVKNGKALKCEYTFKKPRYSCTSCKKELSISQLPRHKCSQI